MAGQKVWLVTNCTSRPRGSLVIASCHEVAISNASLHKPVARIQRIEAQGSDLMLDRLLGFSPVELGETEKRPR